MEIFTHYFEYPSTIERILYRAKGWKYLQNRDGMNHIALLSVPIVWWRKPCEGLHAGMVHLLRGDVRKAWNRA